MGKLSVVIREIFVDDDEDAELVERTLRFYLAKIHKDKKRLVCYIATEPVKQEDGKPEEEEE